MNQGALPAVDTEEIRKLMSERVKRLSNIGYLPNAMIELRAIEQQLVQHVNYIRRGSGVGQKIKSRS